MLVCLWTVALAAGLGFRLSLPIGDFAPWLEGLALGVGGLVVVFVHRGKRPVLAGIFAACLLGAWLGHRAVRPLSLAPALRAAIAADRELEVRGRWVRTLRFASADAAGRGLVVTEAIAGGETALGVAVTVPGAVPGAGDEVRFRARLSEPLGFRNPGLPDARLAARAQGIDLVAWVPPPAGITSVQPGPRWSPRRQAERAHRALAAAIDALVPQPRRAFLKALLLGERSASGPEVEAGFKAAGAVHALSVSGLHLTAVAGALYLIFRTLVLWVPFLARRVRPAVAAALAAIPALLFYCAITGEATATRRAALMAALAFGALAVKRTPSLASAIGASAFVLLIDSPLLLLDASFQLSFVSVSAVALAGARFQPLRGLRLWRRALSWVGRGLFISTVAFVATAPLVTHHFAELAPAAPIGNLLLVPPVELAIVPLGLLGATLGAVWWPLGYLPLRLVDGLAQLTLWLADFFRVTAPVLPTISPDGFEATAGLVAALLVLLYWARPGRSRHMLLAAAVIAGIGAAHLGVRAGARRWASGVRVTFLDVGQGDAAVVEGPGGFVALVDAGGTVDRSFDPGARVIEPVLRRKLIGRIDLVVLSHPHPDHMNGLPRLLDRFAVGALWFAPGSAGEGFEALVAHARRRGVRIDPPVATSKSGLALVPLGPYLGDAIAASPALSTNDASLVVGLGFAGRRILFAGDIEAQGEAELVGRHAPAVLVADVLKVPHHGSRTSSSDELLAVVRPTQAVFSLGRRNRFGFPREEVLARYQARGVEILRTDWNGAVVVEITSGGVLRATCVRSCR